MSTVFLCDQERDIKC